MMRERGAWPDMVEVNEAGHDVKNGNVRREIKVVRWKGIKYTAMTLETVSNKEVGTLGWMEHSDAEILEYWFEEPDGWRGNGFYMPLLQDWFWKNYKNYYEHSQPNKSRGGGTYHTLSRVVPLMDIPDDIYVFRNRYISKQGG